MKPAPFEYHRPASLAETFDLLDRYGDDGRILAGGQSLVPTLNMRLVTPRAVIDINRLPGLDAIRADARRASSIGALVRQEALERSALVTEHAPLIAAAMPHVGPRGDPDARHRRRQPGAGRSRRRAAGLRRRARGDDPRHGPRAAGGTSRRRTSFAASTRPRSSRARSSPRSWCRARRPDGAGGSRSWRAVTATSRSRAWPRACASSARRSPRRGSCSSASARRPSAPAAPRPR